MFPSLTLNKKPLSPKPSPCVLKQRLVSNFPPHSHPSWNPGKDKGKGGPGVWGGLGPYGEGPMTAEPHVYLAWAPVADRPRHSSHAFLCSSNLR